MVIKVKIDCHKLVEFSFQGLLPDAVLLQDLAGNFKLDLVDVSGPEDRTEVGRLLLLSCKEGSLFSLSPLFFKKSSLFSLSSSGSVRKEAG